MENLEDVQLFSRFISTPLLAWNIRRDSIRFEEEHKRSQVHKGSLIPLYDGQYNIDYYLYTLESYFSQGSVQEEDKAIVVEQHLTGSVLEGYEAMQWGRIHRGEAYIDDWPSMKRILRTTFHPRNSWVKKVVFHRQPINAPIASQVETCKVSSDIPSKESTKSVQIEREEHLDDVCPNNVSEDSEIVHMVQEKAEVASLSLKHIWRGCLHMKIRLLSSAHLFTFQMGTLGISWDSLQWYSRVTVAFRRSSEELNGRILNINRG